MAISATIGNRTGARCQPARAARTIWGGEIAPAAPNRHAANFGADTRRLSPVAALRLSLATGPCATAVALAAMPASAAAAPLAVTATAAMGLSLVTLPTLAAAMLAAAIEVPLGAEIAPDLRLAIGARAALANASMIMAVSVATGAGRGMVVPVVALSWPRVRLGRTAVVGPTVTMALAIAVTAAFALAFAALIAVLMAAPLLRPALLPLPLLLWPSGRGLVGGEARIAPPILGRDRLPRHALDVTQ